MRARESIAGWHEGEIDGLIAALAAQIAGHADELAAATVAETGTGCAPRKADKNRFASLDVAQSLAGKPGVGVVGGCEREAVTEIAGPVGGVLGLIPVTSPVAALVFKALICIKARDALIVSCHRDAAGVGARTVDLLRQVLGRHGAPADLLKVSRAARPAGPPQRCPADPRQRRPRPYGDHPHPQQGAAVVLRAADADEPGPGQRSRGARLHRPRQRADAIPHAWLRDLRPHLGDRQRNLHQPGQHQAGSASARWPRRPCWHAAGAATGHFAWLRTKAPIKNWIAVRSATESLAMRSSA